MIVILGGLTAIGLVVNVAYAQEPTSISGFNTGNVAPGFIDLDFWIALLATLVAVGVVV